MRIARHILLLLNFLAVTGAAASFRLDTHLSSQYQCIPSPSAGCDLVDVGANFNQAGASPITNTQTHNAANNGLGASFTSQASAEIGAGLVRLSGTLSVVDYQSDAWNGIFVYDPDSPGGLGLEFMPVYIFGSYIDTVTLNGAGGPVDVQLQFALSGSASGCDGGLVCTFDAYTLEGASYGSQYRLTGQGTGTGPTSYDTTFMLTFHAVPLNTPVPLGTGFSLIISGGEVPTVGQPVYTFTDSADFNLGNTIRFVGAQYSRGGQAVTGITSQSELGLDYSSPGQAVPEPASGLLFGAGAAAVALYRRRRRGVRHLYH